MWVIIMTFAVLTAVSYLVYFDRHVRFSAMRHLAATVATYDRAYTARRTRLLRRIVRRTSSRILALAVVTATFVVCWYPLHVLTIVDSSFRHPFKVGEALSAIRLAQVQIPY